MMKFKHRYYKLKSGRNFTTIRINPDEEIGTIHKINVNSKFLGISEVIAKERFRFDQIPLERLQADAEYKGFIIKTRNDFVKLFYKLTKQLIIPSTKLTILTMRWCRPELKVG